MVRTLRDVLAEFLAKPPGEIGIYTIRTIGIDGDTVEPADGSKLLGHPTKCAFEKELHRTPVEIGRLVDHVGIMRRALLEGNSYAVVFDDCMPGAQYSLELLEAYLAGVKGIRDTFAFQNTDEFILLGTTGCNDLRFLTDRIRATNNFNGAQAYIAGRKMMEKFIKTYEFLLSKEVVYPVDGLLGLLLRLENFWALSPENERGLFTSPAK